jgi:asparagine synthase (glutamine-hydrolysing)
MCGICGIVGAQADAAIEDMAACLSHRGPDAWGVHHDGDVALANRRLRIIDVEGGDQPIYDEDGDVVVVYNGAIYNYQSLRADLQDVGHRFSTDADTEVVVHGYEEYGPDVFERLNGMFAIALLDASRERLFLVRDRAGIKPLYYARVDGGLVFGSEPKSILRSGRVEAAPDTDALAYFLQLRYAPPRTSLFDGIETLEPGTLIEVDVSDPSAVSVDQRRFWHLTDAVSEPPADPERAVRNTLRRSVRRQLIGDVPIGFYLSGGIDTSSVVAMADAECEEPITTVSMGFEDSEWDERADARAVANHFGTDHHEIALERSFMADFPEMIWHADEPKRNLYPYYVHRAMSDRVTVALGGLGSDELFGGYVYRLSQLAELQSMRRTLGERRRERLQSTMRRVADFQVEEGALENDDVLEDVQTLEHLDDDAQLYVLLNSTDVLGDADFYRKRVFGDGLSAALDPPTVVRERHDPRPQTDLRAKALEWDFSLKLPEDFLLVEDRTSMAHSLESRVPFLDNEMIDLAFSLPLSEKLDGTDGATAGKSVLRRSMRDRLPDVVFEKDKQGFTMPTLPFVREELLEHAREILARPFIVRDGLVEGAYVDALLERQPTASLEGHYKLLWKLVGLEIWYQLYVVGDVAGPDSIETYYT